MQQKEFTKILRAALESVLQNDDMKDGKTELDEKGKELELEKALGNKLAKILDEKFPGRVKKELLVRNLWNSINDREHSKPNDPRRISTRSCRIDIVVDIDGQLIPIELKHKKAGHDAAGGNLPYDFVKDILRIEEFLKIRKLDSSYIPEGGKSAKDIKIPNEKAQYGYAIISTDIKAVYAPEKCCKKNGCDHADCSDAPCFNSSVKLFDGVDITPEHAFWWRKDKSPQNTGGRGHKIILKHTYPIHWETVENSDFHYLLIPVLKENNNA